jgi:hypothetical protein
MLRRNVGSKNCSAPSCAGRPKTGLLLILPQLPEFSAESVEIREDHGLRYPAFAKLSLSSLVL